MPSKTAVFAGMKDSGKPVPGSHQGAVKVSQGYQDDTISIVLFSDG